jgi:hypothetical protein
MKAMKTMAVALVAGLSCVLAGCMSSDTDTPKATAAPTPVENVSVELAPGRTLQGAIMAAAAHRRWLPTKKADGTIRCTLSQREHMVVVDVVPVGEKAFSIRMVQSNIPVRKYDQWVNNLSREIVMRASR